jgi:hypothetical protein
MVDSSARARLIGSGLGAILSGLILIGVLIALLGATWGIVLTPAGVFAYFLLNIAVGIVGYRGVIRRPWPKVPPIEGDDDDW